MSERKHLSASQIGMFLRCPEQWHRRYVRNEVRPPGIAAHVGTGLHRGAEFNLRQKIESHHDLPAKEIIEAAVAGFDDRLAEDGAMLTPEEVSRGKLRTADAARDTVARVAKLHAEQVAPEYQPVEVEVLSRFAMPELSYDIVGITDLRDNKNRVVDWKTSKRTMAKSAADTSLQLTIYAAAFLHDRDVAPSELRLDLTTTSEKPKRQVLTTQRTFWDLVILRDTAAAIVKAIEADIHLPCEVGAWCCSPKWCGYFQDCKFVNSERLMAAEKED